MSTTNRAFIKAYRHDTAQPGGAVGEPVVAPENAPAARVANIPGAPMTIGAMRSAKQRAVGVQATTERRPLSSYIAQPQPIEQIEVADKIEAFRPGTTVASFQWPAVCRTLLQQAGPELDQVVRVLLTRARAGNSLIGVLGLFSQIGATTTALCLASRAAGRNRRVVLAEGNFRSPRVASLLEVVPTAGWEDVLANSAPLSDAVIHATSDNLDVLTLGNRPVKDPKPLVGGLQAAMTAGVLRHAYDLVIVDLGTFFDPVSQPTVLDLISNLGLDAAVAIAGPEPADRRDVATIVEFLDHSSCELLGLIENRIAKPRAA